MPIGAGAHPAGGLIPRTRRHQGDLNETRSRRTTAASARPPPSSRSVSRRALAGCGGSSDSTTSGASSGSASNAAATSGAGSTQLQLVALLDAEEGLRRADRAFAQTSAGKGVSFGQSFGASGSQSRAVDTGQPADVVAFSTTPDMTRLVKDGIVVQELEREPRAGLLERLGRGARGPQGQPQAHHRLG